MGKIQISTGKENVTSNTTTVWDRIVALESNLDDIPENIGNTMESLETQLAQNAKKFTWVTPEDFGAVGNAILTNGSFNSTPTDDTTAVQQAIDYALTNRVPLRLHSKGYAIYQPLIISSTLSIYGTEVENRLLGWTETSKTTLVAYGDFPLFKSTGSLNQVTLANLTLRAATTNKGYGLEINLGNGNVLRGLTMKNVSISYMKQGVYIKTGAGIGIGSNYFDRCNFTENLEYGFVVEHTGADDLSFMNQNVFSDCTISNNMGGVFVQNIPIQNLKFVDCRLEHNGLDKNTIPLYNQGFAFKSTHRYTDVTFDNCYIEYNLPHRFKNGAILETEEVYSDYYFYKGTTDPYWFGDIIVGNTTSDVNAISNVRINGGVISLSSRVIVLQSHGNAVIDGGHIYNTFTTGSPTSANQSIFHLQNFVGTSNNNIKLVDCSFAGGTNSVKNVVESSNSSLINTTFEGNLLKDNLVRYIKATPTQILGTSTIYVDTVNGIDTNCGVLKSHPVKSLNRAVDLVNMTEANEVTINATGALSIVSIPVIKNKRVILDGNATTTTLTPSAHTDQTGYYYIALHNAYLHIKNISVNLNKPEGIATFTRNFAFQSREIDTLELTNVVVTSNDAACTLVNTTGKLIGVLNNSATFNNSGVMVSSSSLYTELYVRGLMPWSYPRKAGTTAQRPTASLPTGFLYFDTTLDKPIYWNGSIWKDSAGTAV